MDFLDNIKSAKVKGAKPTPLPPCPHFDVIRVAQFQFFDSGPKPGRGKYQHSLSLEVHCGDRIDLLKPDWKRAIGLSGPETVVAWASKEYEAGSMTAEQHDTYQSAIELCEYLKSAHGDDLAWVKLGRIRDKRTRTDYPGHFVIAWRLASGNMECHAFIDGGRIECERFIRDKFAMPGSKRRKAYGFYDPSGLYYQQKAVEVWQDTRGELGTVADIKASMIEAAKAARTWKRTDMIRVRGVS